MGYRYDKRNTDAGMIRHIKERMARELLLQHLKLLLLDNDRFYAVRLQQDEELSVWSASGETVDLRMRLTINESEERVIEYVDYRPMDWMQLSQTALEEIKRRLTDWWRRPLSRRLYLFRFRLGAFERRHFGRAFKSKGLP